VGVSENIGRERNHYDPVAPVNIDFGHGTKFEGVVLDIDTPVGMFISYDYPDRRYLVVQTRTGKEAVKITDSANGYVLEWNILGTNAVDHGISIFNGKFMFDSGIACCQDAYVSYRRPPNFGVSVVCKPSFQLVRPLRVRLPDDRRAIAMRRAVQASAC
jgi:hypothetical protein